MVKLVFLPLLFTLSSCSTFSGRGGNDFSVYDKLNLSDSILKTSFFIKKENKNMLDFRNCLDGEIDSTVSKLKDQIIKKGNSFVINRDIGNCELLRGNYDRAFYYFDRLLSLVKKFVLKAQIYNSMGILYYKRQLFSYADEYFALAQSLNRKSQISLYNRVILRIRLAKYAEASNLINRNLRRISDPIYWKKLIGLNYFLDGNYKSKLFKLLKNLDDKSNESEFLKLISTAKYNHKNIDDLSMFIDQVDAYDFEDPVWQELQIAALQRLEKDKIAYEKD